MRSTMKQLLPALAALAAVGCGSFLTGPGLTQDPNAPSSASRDQRLAAVQAAMTIQFTGTLARAVCMWMQQCSGVQRQYATLDLYNTTEDDFDTEWSQVYGGGGLIDIRAIEQEAAAAGDSVYEGVGKVLEAMDVGTAADLWGDIPYSEAVGDSATPHFDAQQDVYAAVQNVLDQAIAELGGPGSGPGQVDLWYNGDAAKWMELAHTLKARFYLHTAERDPSSYGKALAEAQQGISTSANDLVTYQSSTTTEQNVWYQFQIVQRSGYLAMGARLVNLMVARNDPRLANYFSLDGNGQYGGAPPGGPDDPDTQSNLSVTRLDPAYRQPLVTHAENQLIIAEAAYQTGDQTTALNSLNAERTAAGLPALSAITGPVLLDSIMTEKYVVTFQNLEAWNDYKRECIPALTPAGGAAQVIARPYYGASEINTNPNFPGEPTSGRNWNDPNACP
jgi:hypothetical protein